MKTFFQFLNLLLVSWIITESVSRINMSPTITSIARVFVSIAISQRFAHNARLQTSHIKNLAGLILNHKNATSAPQIETQSVESKKSH